MKFTRFFILISIISFVTTSCYRRGGPWGITGKGSNVTETRSVSGFDEIDLDIDADIEFRQDSVYKLEVSAQENILAVLETEVKGDELHIDYKRNVWKHNKVKLIIHAPKLEGVRISGSGDVAIQNTITVTDLDISISGSGNVTIPAVIVKNLQVRISGSGDIRIDGGVCDNQTLSISGSGDMDLEELVSQSTTAKISGSGGMRIHVIESLDASISGSGDIKYKGRPVIDSHISGSGRLVRIN